MKIEIKEYFKYNDKEIFELYQSVGWTNYTDKPEMIERAYRNSLKILAAYNGE